MRHVLLPGLGFVILCRSLIVAKETNRDTPQTLNTRQQSPCLGKYSCGYHLVMSDRVSSVAAYLLAPCANGRERSYLTDISATNQWNRMERSCSADWPVSLQALRSRLAVTYQWR
jgi:hypothetical protein